MIINMKKTDKTKGGARTAIGMLLMACMVIAGALLPKGTVQAAEAAITPAIDFDKTGSITIHKYEYNGSNAGTATGKEGDSANVPNTEGDKAEPLAGVEFTIYQVRTAGQLKAIYQGTTTDETMPILATYWDTANGTWQSGMPDSSLTQQGAPATTDSDGKVTFTNLPIGIYLVVETDAPSQVTKKSAFLVSIPTTVDNNSWLYDVHVFPKNATTYGQTVTLIKKGSDNKKLTGVTFVLQREGTDKTWSMVVLTNDDGSEKKLITNDDGEIRIENLVPGTYRLIETNIGDNTGYIGDFTKTYEFVVDNDGNITKKNAGDDYIVVNEGGSATITVTNEKPDMEKKVKDKDGDWKQDADYSVGDTISYQIKVKVPENIANLKTFKVTDTPNGIQYTSETLKVYQANNDGTMGADLIDATNNYTLTEDTTTSGFTVAFNTKSTAITDNAGKNIYITYDAVLLSNAASANGTVNAGNTNTVQLTYSRYTTTDSTPDDGYPDPPVEEEDTIEDTAVVYTFQMDIVKKGKDDNGNETSLQGVTFDLYRQATDADTDTDKISDADAKAAGLDTSDNQKWVKINNTTSLTTAADGKVSVTGLKNGIYYLVETATVNGYNLLSKPVKIELNVEYETDFASVSADSSTDDSTDTSTNSTIIKKKYNGVEITSNSTVNGNTIESEITILNTKGFTLPTTGGMGGFVFAVAGCMIMVAGILLFKKTKKKPENE